MTFLKRLFYLGKDTSYEKAMIFYNKNMYKEAIGLFEETLERKPSTSSLHHNLARVYCGQAHRNLGIMLFATSNFSSALKEFQASLRFSPENIEILYFIGVCQNNLGEFEDAIEIFNTILEVENLSNNKKVKVRINDRGPFKPGRIIDLSYAAAKKIDMIKSGTAKIRARIIKLGGKP